MHPGFAGREHRDSKTTAISSDVYEAHVATQVMIKVKISEQMQRDDSWNVSGTNAVIVTCFLRRR